MIGRWLLLVGTTPKKVLVIALLIGRLPRLPIVCMEDADLSVNTNNGLDFI